MEKLKIGIFMDGFYPEIDGVVLVIDNLAKELSKIADVTMVVPYTSSVSEDVNRPYKVIRINSIPIPTTEYRLGIPALKQISINKELLNEKFDIIHIHSPFTIGELGIKIARKLKVPVVATMHTRFDFEFKKFFKSKKLVDLAIKKIIKVFNKCDKCIALNSAMVKVFDDYGYIGTPIIEYNGTDMETVENPEKAVKRVNKLYNITDDEKVFLFVGRLNSVKNIFFILDVLEKLKEKQMKFKMLYVGTGPDEDELKKRVIEHKLQNDVVLTGKIMDRELLKSIYYRADMFVFPSLFDASSLVQIEAASQYTPSIFIEGAVTADTVTNNENGFTAPNDVQQFTDRIIEIFDNKELYEKVCKGAKEQLAKSWKTIAKETFNIYTDIINNFNRKT